MLRKTLATLSSRTNPVRSRNLYSASVLGLDGYEMYREKSRTQHMHNVDNFKQKMREFVAGSATNMVFTEDLKNVIHLVEDTAEDKKLLMDMMDKYNSQSKELRFGNYVFGPVVMRSLYFMKDPALALQIFKDEKYQGFFDQISTYLILGDLLYEAGMYPQVRELFDLIKSRQIQGGRYPKHSVTLTFAACYKENTQEAYQYAMDLWKELNAVGHVPMRKATSFAAALALKHNQPGIALEIASTVINANYVTIRQIKTLALAALSRFDDLIPILRVVLEIHSPLEKRHTFCREVIEEVKRSVDKIKDKAPQDLLRILEYLEVNGHVNDTTLDGLLCQEIVSIAQKKDNNNLADSYRSRGGSQPVRSFTRRSGERTRFFRPGLAEMS